jgi:hypothetical protein
VFIRVHSWPNSRLLALPFALGAQQHRALQVCAGGEAGDAFGSHFHRAAATRVPHLPRLPVRYSESAETREGDVVPARQACLDSVKERVECPRRLRSRQSCIDCHLADHVFLIHRTPNARELYQRSDAGVNRGGWAETYDLLYSLSGINMDQNTVRLIAGVLALLLVVIVVMRRKKKKSVDDEF